MRDVIVLIPDHCLSIYFAAPEALMFLIFCDLPNFGCYASIAKSKVSTKLYTCICWRTCLLLNIYNNCEKGC